MNCPHCGKQISNYLIYHKRYYEKNKELIIKKNKEWISSHPGKNAQYSKAYRERKRLKQTPQEEHKNETNKI